MDTVGIEPTTSRNHGLDAEYDHPVLRPLSPICYITAFIPASSTLLQPIYTAKRPHSSDCHSVRLKAAIPLSGLDAANDAALQSSADLANPACTRKLMSKGANINPYMTRNIVYPMSKIANNAADPTNILMTGLNRRFKVRLN
ncbi:uncharacterized protein LACBIDRAFT_328072 [Laccaria bicolor S238N-H82]|uniref:Predicted protein n=1 Tax=Laccaria bicolor (strain S238N-H82 / ATCC MYA-4686) TaxID=486041 RepID=B0DDN5_LACBS|nr:uncharacterized protein LACBIDRAFT_328072 [Laccaria bicolor S238N-H82]EDR07245.1 predicted protein [Laccaria bicolor S238N-H82]|eukprot:XP_001882176.1 predicted protein [Laccaria bicolor S238N-H82]